MMSPFVYYISEDNSFLDQMRGVSLEVLMRAKISPIIIDAPPHPTLDKLCTKYEYSKRGTVFKQTLEAL